MQLSTFAWFQPLGLNEWYEEPARRHLKPPFPLVVAFSKHRASRNVLHLTESLSPPLAIRMPCALNFYHLGNRLPDQLVLFAGGPAVDKRGGLLMVRGLTEGSGAPLVQVERDSPG